MSTDRIWYYTVDDRAHGPESWDGLISAVQHGNLKADGDVWFPGLSNWIPAAQVPGIHAPALRKPSDEAPSLSAGRAVPPPIVLHRLSAAQTGGARPGVVASRTVRLVAFLVDMAAMVTVAFMCFLLMMFSSIMQGGNTDNVSESAWVLLIFGTLAFVLCVLAGFEIANNGRSFGKKLAGLRVVRVDGKNASATRLVLRTFIKIVPPVILALAAIGAAGDKGWWIALGICLLPALPVLLLPKRTGLHDLLTNCTVVRI
ncbi:MAG: RDD family protein [Gemmatimonas sp.]